jgi:hypothetical protein
MEEKEKLSYRLRPRWARKIMRMQGRELAKRESRGYAKGSDQITRPETRQTEIRPLSGLRGISIIRSLKSQAKTRTQHDPYSVPDRSDRLDAMDRS